MYVSAYRKTLNVNYVSTVILYMTNPLPARHDLLYCLTMQSEDTLPLTSVNMVVSEKFPRV